MDNWIDLILDRGDCARHNAKRGLPCWWLHASKRGKVLPAICNNRARRAGFHDTETSVKIDG